MGHDSRSAFERPFGAIVFALLVGACSWLGDDDDGTIAAGSTSDGSPPQLRCSANLLDNPGFESGSSGWAQASLVYPDLVCDSDCVSDGSIEAHAGDRFLWLGGHESSDTASIRQSVRLPSGTVRLSFWLRVDSRGTRGRDDTLTVSLGDRTWFEADESDIEDFGEYAEVELERAHAGGTETFDITARLSGEHLTSFVIDDVSIRVCGPQVPTVPDDDGGGSSSTGSGSSTDAGSSSTDAGSSSTDTGGDTSDTGTAETDTTG